jgi:hypothetical protein
VVALKGSGVANEQIVQIVCKSDVSVGSSIVDTLARRCWVKILALFSRMLDIISLKKQARFTNSRVGTLLGPESNIIRSF